MKTKRGHYILGRMFFGFLFILSIMSIGYYINSVDTKAATCFTTAQVASDSRCLYVYRGKVYEKGTKLKPHKSNPCGTDVTSIIPSFHFANMAKYMDPNYRGDICAGNSTPTPTSPAPTATVTPTTPANTGTPTPTPTPATTITPGASCSLHNKGDADCNGAINLADFEVFRKEYVGQLSTKQSDFDDNGFVTITDFEIFRKGYLNI